MTPRIRSPDKSGTPNHAKLGTPWFTNWPACNISLDWVRWINSDFLVR